MTGARYALAVLFIINLMNFFDRQILGAVGEQIRREWGLGDTALGALGTAFTLLYAFAGVPLGRLADHGTRKHILAVGVAVWSLLTAASGLARNFWELFAIRLGVGVGEASYAPTAISLIASLGPLGTGIISDHFTAQAASVAGVTDHSIRALEPFRGAGLHWAMYVIPILAAMLALVLFGASRTVRKDIEALHVWTAGQIQSQTAARLAGLNR